MPLLSLLRSGFGPESKFLPALECEWGEFPTEGNPLRGEFDGRASRCAIYVKLFTLNQVSRSPSPPPSFSPFPVPDPIRRWQNDE